MVNRRPTDSPQSPDRWNEVNSRPTEGKYPGNRREGTGADGSEQTQSVTQNKKYAVEFTHKRVGTSCKYNQSLGNRTGVPFVCEITSLNSRRYLNFIAFFFRQFAYAASSGIGRITTPKENHFACSMPNTWMCPLNLNCLHEAN